MSPHGSRSRYVHGCRCTRCRAAEVAYQAQRRLEEAEFADLADHLHLAHSLRVEGTESLGDLAAAHRFQHLASDAHREKAG